MFGAIAAGAKYAAGTEFGKAALAAGGKAAGSAAAGYLGDQIGDKVLGIPKPGERALEAMNTMYPGTDPYQRLGAQGGGAPAVENTKQQTKNAKRIAFEQNMTQEKVAKVTARGGLAQAIANSGISDPNVLKELMAFVEDGKKPGGNQMFTEGTHPKIQDSNSNRMNALNNMKQTQINEMLANIEHDQKVQQMYIDARGGNGYGRLVDFVMSKLGYNVRELQKLPEYRSTIGGLKDKKNADEILESHWLWQTVFGIAAGGTAAKSIGMGAKVVNSTILAIQKIRRGANAGKLKTIIKDGGKTSYQYYPNK